MVKSHCYLAAKLSTFNLQHKRIIWEGSLSKTKIKYKYIILKKIIFWLKNFPDSIFLLSSYLVV